MKVSELISELRKYPQDMDVYLRSDDGLSTIVDIRILEIVVRDWLYGKHVDYAHVNDAKSDIRQGLLLD